MAMTTGVDLKWTRVGLGFEGTAGGGTATFASGLDAGGDGMTPMQAVLLALGACTGMDVVSILRKMRQPVESFRVEVRGEQRGEHPQVYTAIEVVYHLRGDLDDARVRRAIELSETRYCPVEAMLRPSVQMHSRYAIEA
jgi:putative redox protein